MEDSFNVKVTGLTHAEVRQLSSSSRRSTRELAEKRAKNTQLFQRIFSIFNLKILIMSVTQIFFAGLRWCCQNCGNFAAGNFSERN